MQHTNKYQLNLVETSDTFSPAPLNENMQKVEAALETKAQAADHTALDRRVQVLEARRIVYGSYTDDGTAQTISLGFTPALVLTHYASNIASAMALPDRPYSRNGSLKIVPGGFAVASTAESIRGNYCYLAIL